MLGLMTSDFGAGARKDPADFGKVRGSSRRSARARSASVR
jgi:hypothetical protein